MERREYGRLVACGKQEVEEYSVVFVAFDLHVMKLISAAGINVGLLSEQKPGRILDPRYHRCGSSCNSCTFSPNSIHRTHSKVELCSCKCTVQHSFYIMHTQSIIIFCTTSVGRGTRTCTTGLAGSQAEPLAKFNTKINKDY